MTEERDVLVRGGREPDAILRFGDHPDQIVDVRSGANGVPTNTPVVALIHGGYWRPEWDRAHMRPMADALAADGYIAANIEYRRIPGDPDAMVHDIAAAVRRISADHPERELVVVGFSAGGHLALWLAGQQDFENRVAMVVALAPVADVAEAERLNLDDGAARAFLGASAMDRPDLDPMHSTMHVPVRILHASDDDLVPIALSERYAERHGIDVLRTTGGHFALIDPEHETWAMVRESVRGMTGTMPS